MYFSTEEEADSFEPCVSMGKCGVGLLDCGRVGFLGSSPRMTRLGDDGEGSEVGFACWQYSQSYVVFALRIMSKLVRNVMFFVT